MPAIVDTQKETLSFETEVAQLLRLVTHSLYSNKEIFLRELISNASDAADKLRFEALSDSALYGDDPDLKIWIDFDKDKRTITLRDNGIGMNREEIVENLGTIAKSGTREFLEKLAKEQAKDRQLIGQFGVGFYSAFVVADKVDVRSRRAGMLPDQGVLWQSTGEGNFTVENIEKTDRGTEIVLYLAKDQEEFLDGYRLRSIIQKYSDHILLPILMKKEPMPADDEEKEEKKTEKTPEYETVNKATALWTLPKSEIKKEEYKELYKHIAHDFEDPLYWSHNRVEGKLEYISLLYIPSRAPFDLFQREGNPRGLKLYVQRVFIMDDAQQLLPNYLRFVKGIVDSNDLPLNISRELLQNNKTIDSIRSGCTKRILSMIEEISKNHPDKYKLFWENFGRTLKEGPAEDFANREQIAKLLRFASTDTDTQDQNVSFDDYIARMQAKQEKIYYVTADSFMAAKNSPHLEIFRKKGIEVLLLSDTIDEWLVAHLNEYEGKKFQSVAKGDIDFKEEKETETTKEEGGEKPEEKEKKTKAEEDKFGSVIKQIKRVLEGSVKDVRVTHRLTDSPACLVTEEHEMSIHLQNMLKAAGQEVPEVQPIFEINPTHPLIEKLSTEQDDDKFKELSLVLFDQAKLAEGGSLKDPATFVKRLNKLLLEVA